MHLADSGASFSLDEHVACNYLVSPGAALPNSVLSDALCYLTPLRIFIFQLSLIFHLIPSSDQTLLSLLSYYAKPNEDEERQAANGIAVGRNSRPVFYTHLESTRRNFQTYWNRSSPRARDVGRTLHL